MRIKNIIIGVATAVVLLGGAVTLFVKVCSEIEKSVQQRVEEARIEREIMKQAMRVHGKVNWIKEGF